MKPAEICSQRQKGERSEDSDPGGLTGNTAKLLSLSVCIVCYIFDEQTAGALRPREGGLGVSCPERARTTAGETLLAFFTRYTLVVAISDDEVDDDDNDDDEADVASAFQSSIGCNNRHPRRATMLWYVVIASTSSLPYFAFCLYFQQGIQSTLSNPRIRSLHARDAHQAVPEIDLPPPPSPDPRP